MRSFAERKIKGGKLVGVELEYDGKIESVKILGDFFLYPEDSLRKIENALVGLDANVGSKVLAARISRVVAQEGAEFLGATPEAIAEVICAAVKK